MADELCSVIVRLDAAVPRGDDQAIAGRTTQERQEAIRAGDQDMRCARAVPYSG